MKKSKTLFKIVPVNENDPSDLFYFPRLCRSKEYWLTKIQNELYAVVSSYMEKDNLTIKQFALKIGKSERYVRTILDGYFDGNISNFLMISLACGKVPKIEFEDFKTVIEKREQESEKYKNK